MELFTGLDDIRASSLDIPGLPSRAELRVWITEHDRIEKDTEIFDSGELKRFKAFTKGAFPMHLQSEVMD